MAGKGVLEFFANSLTYMVQGRGLICISMTMKVDFGRV